MSIEFHCQYCGKLVRAPDNAGGKHGKCPACEQSVYIPTASSEIETLAIAPIDDEAEREQQRALKETHDLQHRILHEKDTLPPDKGKASSSGRSGQVMMPRLDMETLLVEYAKAMASGDLKRADEMAADIRTDKKAAANMIEKLTVDEIPPASLAHIPRPVLLGFFRRLGETIK